MTKRNRERKIRFKFLFQKNKSQNGAHGRTLECHAEDRGSIPSLGNMPTLRYNSLPNSYLQNVSKKGNAPSKD